MPRAQPQITEAQEPLCQIWVDENHPRWGKREIAVGPKMHRKYLGPLMEEISKAIIDGRDKTWRNPRLVLCPETAAPADSPFTREDRQNELVGGYREPAPATPSLILN